MASFSLGEGLASIAAGFGAGQDKSKAEGRQRSLDDLSFILSGQKFRTDQEQAGFNREAAQRARELGQLQLQGAQNTLSDFEDAKLSTAEKRKVEVEEARFKIQALGGGVPYDDDESSLTPEQFANRVSYEEQLAKGYYGTLTVKEHNEEVMKAYRADEDRTNKAIKTLGDELKDNDLPLDGDGRKSVEARRNELIKYAERLRVEGPKGIRTHRERRIRRKESDKDAIENFNFIDANNAPTNPLSAFGPSPAGADPSAGPSPAGAGPSLFDPDALERDRGQAPVTEPSGAPTASNEIPEIPERLRTTKGMLDRLQSLAAPDLFSPTGVTTKEKLIERAMVGFTPVGRDFFEAPALGGNITVVQLNQMIGQAWKDLATNPSAQLVLDVLLPIQEIMFKQGQSSTPLEDFTSGLPEDFGRHINLNRLLDPKPTTLLDEPGRPTFSGTDDLFKFDINSAIGNRSPSLLGDIKAIDFGKKPGVQAKTSDKESNERFKNTDFDFITRDKKQSVNDLYQIFNDIKAIRDFDFIGSGSDADKAKAAETVARRERMAKSPVNFTKEAVEKRAADLAERNIVSKLNHKGSNTIADKGIQTAIRGGKLFEVERLVEERLEELEQQQREALRKAARGLSEFSPSKADVADAKEILELEGLLAQMKAESEEIDFKRKEAIKKERQKAQKEEADVRSSLQNLRNDTRNRLRALGAGR